MIHKRRIQGNMITSCKVNCPICNHVAYFSESLTSEITECPVCGYEQDINKETNNTYIHYGYGVFYAEFVNKPFMYIVFDEPISENEKQNLLEIMNDFYIIKEKSYFYLYDVNRNEIQILKGNKPKLFDDYVEESKEKLNYAKLQYLSDNDNFIPFE